jgi:hypothetical protein
MLENNHQQLSDKSAKFFLRMYFRQLFDKWKSFTKSQLRNLVESFPNRVKKTINNE